MKAGATDKCASDTELMGTFHTELMGIFHTELMGTFHTELMGTFHVANHLQKIAESDKVFQNI